MSPFRSPVLPVVVVGVGIADVGVGVGVLVGVGVRVGVGVGVLVGVGVATWEVGVGELVGEIDPLVFGPISEYLFPNVVAAVKSIPRLSFVLSGNSDQDQAPA